ncbi:MAG: M1 family aminopeptidase [Cyclobacteriaceae bacterium]
MNIIDYKYKLSLLLLLVLFWSCKTGQDLSTSKTTKFADTVDIIAEPIVVTPKDTEYRPERTKLHDLLHTRLEVSFDWQQQRLNGLATLELTPYFYPQDDLTLDAKNFDIHRVALISALDTLPLNYEYDNTQLQIELDKTYNKEEKYLIFINYTAKPNEREAGGSDAITSDKGLYFINPLGEDPDKPRQIWTQGETESNSFWFPTIDAPNERTTQEIFITVDEQFVTLSNGLLISSKSNNDGTRTDYWKMDLSHAPYLFMMAIGDYAIVKDEWHGMEVSYYVEPEYEPHARAIFGNTPEMLTFFSELLGYKYPWPKYSQVVVRDFVSGAMENTTASVYMEDLQSTSRELIDFHWDGIIAHELFHHWTGNLLTCESWANLPLNEAFANYSEYLWFEYKYGKNEAEYHNIQELQKYLHEAEDKQVDLIRFYYDDRESMFDNHSYAKGGRTLHMLRHYLGDKAFFAGLRHYIKQHEFQDVEIHNLRLAFEEVTGEDLNWFFNQWFLASGHPELKVESEYDSLAGQYIVKVWQQQDIENTPVYKLPVDIEIFSEGKSQVHSVVVEKLFQEFTFDYTQKPELLLFDVQSQLVAEITHEKSSQEYVYQYENSKSFTARYHALEALIENIDQNYDYVVKALNDEAWAIRELALSGLNDFEGEHSTVLEEKLVKLVTNDEKSLVRADALNLLSLYDFEKHEEVFKEALNDSSYSVLGVALYNIAESQMPEREKIMERFEHENNINIIFPIANYYSQSQLDKYDWFAGKLKQMSGTDLWYMLQFFGEYLMNSSLEVQQKGASLLENQARNSSNYYVRLAAYQALGLLDKIENVENIREDIRAKETDSRLNQIYQSMD